MRFLPRYSLFEIVTGIFPTESEIVTGIFPIEVDAIELVKSEEVDGVVDKFRALHFAANHLREACMNIEQCNEVVKSCAVRRWV